MEKAGEKPGPLLWEQLVTAEHVRAARLRAVQPLLIGLGVVLVIVGVLWQLSIPHTAVPTRDDLIIGQVEGLERPAVEAVAGLSGVSVKHADFKKLVQASEVSSIIPIILSVLKANGQLPADRLTLVQTDADHFWRRPWPFTSLIATGTGDVRVVGAVVNSGTVYDPALKRWLGVFRKIDGQWKCASISGSAFFSAGPSAPVTDIAIDLNPTLPQG